MLNRKVSRRAFLAISTIAAASFGLDWKRIALCAEKMGQTGDYPTVIIGSGLGGLCCGAYLAKQGIPVTVLEQRDKVGGYATSFSRGNGKFTFDVALHGMTARDNSTARILQDLGVLKELEFAELPEVYRLNTPDIEISVPQRDPEKYIHILSEHFPSEKEGIRGFIDEIIGIAQEGDKLHRRGKFSKLTFPFRYPKLYGVFNQTLSEFMNGYTKNLALQNILASLWDFHGLPPSKVSGLYYAAAKGDSLRNGTYYVKPRSRDLSGALAETIKRSGGQILTRAGAERIQVKKGAVTGVAVTGGKTLPARAVLCNANVLDVFQRMLPQEAVPEDYLRQLETYKPSLSTFIVWLGLNHEVRGKIKACGIQSLSGQGPEADYQACLRGEVEKVPYRISVYDNIYEGYSQPGTSTLRILCLSGYKPWRRFEADYRAGRKKEYYKEKARWVRCLIRRAEQILPGLSEMIEIEVAATPLTNWRFTRNTEGAIYGFEQSVDNAYIKRLEHRTPIKGLYLASAWCHPGGGFSGVLLSGQIAFREMMEDWA
ncbi:MAG: NAD(P)/FAD-dependent oxidoreductase [Desulfobacteraceae bacterium]